MYEHKCFLITIIQNNTFITMELILLDMSADSLDKMSEQYIKEKAHVINNNKIELEIEDVRIYPSTKGPTLQFDCGFPLNEFFIRIDLEQLPDPGYDKILNLYTGSFNNLNNFKNKSITIKLKSYNNEKSNVHPEVEELEIPIEFNGINAHICKVPRYYEREMESSRDMSKLKFKCNNSIKKYNMVKKSIKDKSSIQIQEVITDENRSFKLNIGYTKNMTIQVKIDLPPIEKVQNHPVSDFIDNFGSGDIRNLKNKHVYFGYIDNKNCIGEDVRYKKYGIYKNYPSKNKSWFKKIFS